MGIDSLIDDLNGLGVTKVEVNIKYGFNHKNYKESDIELAQELLLNRNEMVRRIQGQAYEPLLELEIVTSSEKRINFRCINENNKGKLVNHIDLYYIDKDKNKVGLLNSINVVTMNSYFSGYLKGKYSPVEFFYICINLTSLCGPVDSTLVVIDNKVEGDDSDSDLGLDSLYSPPPKSYYKPAEDNDLPF